MKSISEAKKLRIWNKSNGRCWYCGCQLTQHDRGASGQLQATANLEHKTPKSKGGKNDDENLVYSCQQCNFSKSASTVEEYRTRLLKKVNPDLAACDLLKKAITQYPEMHGAIDVSKVIREIESEERKPIVFYGETLLTRAASDRGCAA